MSEARVKYLKLNQSGTSLSFDESKNLITYIGEVSKSREFKLIISSQGRTGLRLFVRTPYEVSKSVKKHLFSLNPNFKLAEVKRTEAVLTKPTESLSFVFSRHYAYPLFEPEKAEANALSSLLIHLSQLKPREGIELELSVTPARPLKVKLLQKRLLSGANLKLNDPNLIGQISKVGLASLSSLEATISLLQNLGSTASPKERQKFPRKVVNPRSVMILDKLYEPLFKTTLSVKVKAASSKRARELTEEIGLNLNRFARSSGYQQFKPKSSRSTDVYSASDLAALYTFEDPSLLDTTTTAKALPSSRYIEGSEPGGVIVGISNYRGVDSNLVLPARARQRHLYITGSTGSGKSTMLANLALQDIRSGQGISLIDPHGDLAEAVLERIPEDRLNDVIYFDPTDLGSQVSLNLMEVKSSKDSPEYRQEADQVTESVISLFRKVFSTEDVDSHRIEYVLRNSIHTSLAVPGSTIFTIFRLLTDNKYRLEVIPTIKNQNLVNFWQNELGRAGEYQRVKMSAGVTSKIGRFLFSEPTRRVFGQSKSTLDVDKLMNDKKILICNFSKGRLGEDGSRLFSTAMLTKLQLAALARAKIVPSERTDHYLYVDEFQNFAPSALIQMLSEARKYKLYLTMAEQSPSQQDSLSTSVILANVGNLVCFRAASPKDERLLLPSFDSYLSASDLNNLPAYNFYLRSIAEEVLPPVSGQTIPLPETANAAKESVVSENLSLRLATN